MDSKLFKKIVIENFSKYDILIFKGFEVSLIRTLQNDFCLLDEMVYSAEGIVLKNLSANSMMLSLMSLPKDKKGIMCYESFIEFASNMRNLNIFERKFCVIRNNLFEQYQNPTTTDIPDYDSPELLENSENDSYMHYYSLCQHINGQQMVQYNDVELEENSGCVYSDFITPIAIDFHPGNPADAFRTLSPDDGSLEELARMLYNNQEIRIRNFEINKRNIENHLIGAIAHLAKLQNIKIRFKIGSPRPKYDARQELFSLLKRIWGYDSFRNLQVYRHPDTGREIEEVSQGSIIENVVRQAEAAYHGDDYQNILLTAPTGAGKSLLFQSAAIYLAEKYKLLTIVVQPIVALMNDQVEGMKSRYAGVATINGTKSPDEKESVIKKIASGEVNIVYLAPELLLSYSLSQFVGSRQLGLLVVDEAHTVTTWGRDFRVDYWFLGDYIRQQKKYLDYTFPIFALTATAVYNPTGDNDMVFDTISSLKMNPCCMYIGVVRRDNIEFDIQENSIEDRYESERTLITAKRIKEFICNGQKAVVYFPYKKTIANVIRHDHLKEVRDKIGQYHADLSAEEKRSAAESFKTGQIQVMCATKAFGMGIDVADINIVYHHSVTGNLTDYVQEVGRAARDPKIKGVAKIDFSGDKDYRYIRVLHGLSAIKPWQLYGVLKKLLDLYRMNGEKRNMLISPQDFSFLFQQEDDQALDQKVKSCLLLISNDLQNKKNFPAIIVRAKNIFTKLFISVDEEKKESFLHLYKNFITKVDDDNTFMILDADKLWNKKYSNMSFPKFKHLLYNEDLLGDYHLNFYIKLKVNLHSGLNKSNAESKLREFFTLSESILSYMNTEEKRISELEIRELFLLKMSRNQQDQFVNAFKQIYIPEKRTAYCKSYTKYEADESIETFQLCNHNYAKVQYRLMNSFNKFITTESNEIICQKDDTRVALAELMNCLTIATMQIAGGDLPQVFVRINATTLISDIIRKGTYENDILSSIYSKYKFSERVFTHFFTTQMTNENRWNFIEDYFLGESEEKLLRQ